MNTKRGFGSSETALGRGVASRQPGTAAGRDGTKAPFKLMRSYVKPGSQAERMRHPRVGTHAARRDDLAGGLSPSPEHDLRFRGGRTLADLGYVNFFAGGAASWSQSDIDAINGELSKAMSDDKLNN